MKTPLPTMPKPTQCYDPDTMVTTRQMEKKSRKRGRMRVEGNWERKEKREGKEKTKEERRRNGHTQLTHHGLFGFASFSYSYFRV